MKPRPFAQVDVFTSEPYRGNPVAVVLDGEGLGEAQMQAFARWTNLSETTFVLPPTEAGADYRLRIFTPGGELPFAGHPTLGSCHAWLAVGGAGRGAQIVQQCAAGLVRIRRDGPRLAFAAPPLRRSGPLEPQTVAHAARSLRIDPARVVAHQWVDNGPNWAAVILGSAQEVLALEPDFAAMQGMKLGVVGPWPSGAACAFEVRAFVPSLGVPEDPVTGSLNAGLAQWLIRAGVAPQKYVASQGTAMGREGRVHVERAGEDVWIGGDSVVCIRGTVQL